MENIPHRPLLARHPLLHLAVALSAGILIIDGYPLPLNALLIFGGVFTLVTVVALAIHRHKIAGFCLTAATLVSGSCLATIEQRTVAPTQLKTLIDKGAIPSDRPVLLTGVVDGPVDVARTGLYFSLRGRLISSQGMDMPTSGTVTFIASVPSETAKADYDRLELRHGAHLRVITTLRRADGFRNPGVSQRTEYLDRKGYDAAGLIKSPMFIERMGDESVFPPLALLYAWRARLQQQIDSRFSAETAGVLDAALLGNRYNLLPSAAERFRAAGTFHVLVISGLHISFIGAVTLVIARRFTRRRGAQFITSALVLWAYTVAVGAEASVVRAALMFTIIALAPVIFRRTSSLNALGGAALLLLVWRPRNLFDPSFQLTFLSVLAIVALAWPVLQKMAAIGSWQPTRETPYPPMCSRMLRTLCEALFWSDRDWQRQMGQSVYRCKLFKSPVAVVLERCRVQRLAQYVLATLIVSISVQIFLLPFLVAYFHRLSPASLLLNIFVSVIMAAESIVALAALMLGQLSTTAAAPLIGLTDLLNWLMVHSVDPFARSGLASIRLPGYSGRLSAINVVYYVPVIAICLAIWKWNPSCFSTMTPTKRTALTALIGIQIVLLLLVVFHPFSSTPLDGRLHVSFLDVGQGDSVLVTMPDGTTLLVDGGGRPSFLSKQLSGVSEEDTGPDRRSIGEAVVSQFLWARGLDSVDYLVATHADADHIDGLNDVARNFTVRGALVARSPAEDAEFKKFVDTLKSRSIPLTLLGAGDVLRFGNVTAAVLWPLADARNAAPSRNNDSVVLRLQYGRRQILLTGDIESGAEAAIVQTYPNMKVDVVKVAHHGSRTSSIEPFVAATQPEFAIISVGRTSIFGHPHSEVVHRWKTARAKVVTTGESGTITITTDGSDLIVQRFVDEQ